MSKVQNVIENLKGFDKDELGEISKWIAIELGALRTADEFRETFTDAYHRPLPIYLDELPHSNS